MHIMYKNILLTLGIIALSFNCLVADAKTQAAKTIKLIELVAQSINNDSIKVANKNNTVNYLLKTRDELDNALETMDDAQIAYTNKVTLLDIIKKFDNNLSTQELKQPNRFKINANNKSLQAELSRNISANDVLIRKFTQKALWLDKTFINQLISNISDLAIQNNLNSLIAKCGQYAVIFTYLLSLTSVETLQNLVGDETNFKDNDGKALSDDDFNIAMQKCHWLVFLKMKAGGLLALREITQNIPQNDEASKSTRSASDIRVPNNNRETMKVSRMVAVGSTSDKDHENRGLIPSVQKTLAHYGIANVDVGSIFKISLCPILAKWIGEDLVSCNKKISKQLAKLNAYAQGKKYDGSGELKDANKKMAFDKLIGYEAEKAQLRSAIIYAENKELFDLAEETPNRGYLISGPLDAAKHLASGLAYEIDTAIKGSGKNCKVVTLSAAKIIADKIKLADKIKELETDLKNNFVVLVIENLQNAVAHSKTDSNFWTELIDGINSVANGTKKRFFVVATTNELNAVLTAVQGTGCLENSIQLPMPSKEQREEFIKDQLKKRLVNYSQIKSNSEIVAKLVDATENQTFSDIESSIKKSVLSLGNTTKAVRKLALK